MFEWWVAVIIGGYTRGKRDCGKGETGTKISYRIMREGNVHVKLQSKVRLKEGNGKHYTTLYFTDLCS